MHEYICRQVHLCLFGGSLIVDASLPGSLDMNIFSELVIFSKRKLLSFSEFIVMMKRDMLHI